MKASSRSKEDETAASLARRALKTVILAPFFFYAWLIISALAKLEEAILGTLKRLQALKNREP